MLKRVFFLSHWDLIDVTLFFCGLYRCGHVQGFHEWGLKKGAESKELTCPICLTSGPFVALSMSMEPAAYSDFGPLSHCFYPCGHMVSGKTAM